MFSSLINGSKTNMIESVDVTSSAACFRQTIEISRTRATTLNASLANAGSRNVRFRRARNDAIPHSAESKSCRNVCYFFLSYQIEMPSASPFCVNDPSTLAYCSSRPKTFPISVFMEWFILIYWVCSSV